MVCASITCRGCIGKFGRLHKQNIVSVNRSNWGKMPYVSFPRPWKHGGCRLHVSISGRAPTSQVCYASGYC